MQRNKSRSLFLAKRSTRWLRLRWHLLTWRGMALVGGFFLLIWIKRVHEAISSIPVHAPPGTAASSHYGLLDPLLWRPNEKQATTTNVLEGFPKGEKAGCTRWGGIMPPDVVKKELLSQPPPTGLVVTLLLGRNPVLEGAMCGKFFASQLTHFIQPHELDVLLVIAPSYSGTSGDNKAADGHPPDSSESSLSLARLRQCLSLTFESENQSNQRTWINLDGSKLTTWEYQLPGDGGGASMDESRPTRIFLAKSDIWNNTTKPVPHGMTMDPPACQAPVDYILGTRWYVDDMLHLAILQNYEYFIKLDPDVLFFKPLPLNMLHDMKVRGALFAHTAEYPPRGRSGSAQCAKDIVTAVQEFSHQVDHPTSSTDWNDGLGWTGVPCTKSPQTVFRDADRYYTNFIAGRTDFFQSKHVRALGRYLSQYPNGFFRHRWTDQVFWSMALGLWVTDYDDEYSNNNNNRHQQVVVADYTEFRCAPLRNCWLSSHDAKTFPDASNRCDNKAYFLHTKHVSRWETLLAGQSSLFAGEAPNEVVDPGLRAPRHALPQTTKYRHDCRGSRWG